MKSCQCESCGARATECTEWIGSAGVATRRHVQYFSVNISKGTITSLPFIVILREKNTFTSQTEKMWK
jgi:hypothetical protein